MIGCKRRKRTRKIRGRRCKVCISYMCILPSYCSSANYLADADAMDVEGNLDGGDDEMMIMMGFSGFDTTKVCLLDVHSILVPFILRH